jgi:nucleotide-binding universal stress UspA family protein
MKKTILVGHDESDRGEDALALGGLLSERMNGRLVVARVALFDRLFGGIDPYYKQVEPEITERMERIAENAGAELVTIPSPSPAHGLHHLALQEDADVIVVGSSRRGKVGRALVGSTGQRLLHGAPCAVAIAPVDFRDQDAELSSIAVGYDGLPEADVALEEAVAIAITTGAGIRMVMVAHDPPIVYGKAAGPRTGHQELLKAIENQMRPRLQAAMDMAVRERVAASGEFFTGDPASMLADAASDADLLIVGSRGYGPFRCVLMGSVSAKLISSSKCPVMVVPRGKHAQERQSDDSERIAAIG